MFGTADSVLIREVSLIQSVLIERLHCTLPNSISNALLRALVQCYSNRKVLYIQVMSECTAFIVLICNFRELVCKFYHVYMKDLGKVEATL